MILRSICSAKIHRATVTDANIDYIGSILLPPDLMEMVDNAFFDVTASIKVTELISK